MSGDEVDPQLINGLKAVSVRAIGNSHVWERGTDLIYTVQGGPLRDLKLRWLNSVSLATFADDADLNPFIVSYQVKF